MRRFCLCIGALAGFSALAGEWLPGESPAEVSSRVARQFLSTDALCYRPEGYRGSGYFAEHGYGDSVTPHYSVVSLWVNALQCTRKSGDWGTHDALVKAFDRFYGEDRFALTPIRHVDFTVLGALPAEIFLATGDRRAYDLAIEFAERQWEKPGAHDAYPWYFELPPLEERMSWWTRGYSAQTRLWIDDMYMITFLQTQAYRITGRKTYLERAAKEMALYLGKIQLESGLFHHSPEAPFAWGRGNGWMAGGMALLLEHLPQADEYRADILAAYRKMMNALLRHQRASGLWGQLVDDAESWDETSGSAMFAYAFQSGVNHGWLDRKTFGPAAEKAYRALVARLDDRANLADVCEGTGTKNDRNHYLTRARVNGDPHGQAPLLWLCQAMLDAEAKAMPFHETDPIVYRTDVRTTNCWLKARIPEGMTNFPTLVWFHGGGLTSGWPGFCDLGDNGIAQVTVRYRFLSETDADGCIGDAAAAIAWTVKNIAAYGGDPKRVYVSGHSAGGYLTLMAGMDERRLAPYGLKPTDLAGLIPVSGQVSKHFAVRKFSGDDEPQFLPKIDALAPLFYCARKTAPIGLIVGDRAIEFPCRVEENEFMAASIRKLGRKDVFFREFPCRDHGTVVRPACFVIRDFIRGNQFK